MKIIGITGRAGAGKDTIADYLVASVLPFARVSFAAPIKNMLEAIGVDCTTRALKEVPLPWCGRSPRYLMQTLGTEWGRQLVHERIWLSLAEESITELTASGANVVITDVRFDNEAQLIRDLGGVVWNVARPRAQPVEAHASEGGITAGSVNTWLINDGGFEHLYRQIDEALGVTA